MDNKSFQQVCVFLIRWSESGASILNISFLFGVHQLFIIISLICLLTYSKEHSPSWEANRFSASQEISRILRKPKVHYGLYKCRPTGPVLRQTFQSMPPSYLLKNNLNIILPSTPGFSNWSLFHRFLHQNSLYTSPLHNTCYVSRPNNIGWGVQIIKLLIT